MDNTITGKLIQVLEVKSGTGKTGKDWKSQDFIIETNAQYPTKVCLVAWNNIVDSIQNLNIGSDITLHFNPESREFKGKWYTSLKVWKVELIGINNNFAKHNQLDESKNFNLPGHVDAEPEKEEESDGLPF